MTTTAAKTAKPNVAKTTSATLKVNSFGQYVDGWADLIEDKGGQAETIREDILARLQKRNLPEVAVQKRQVATGFSLNTNRTYIIATTSPGVTTAVYICKFGKDLYASWRTHIRPVLNDKRLIKIALVILLLAILAGLINGLSSARGEVINSFKDFFAAMNAYEEMEGMYNRWNRRRRWVSFGYSLLVPAILSGVILLFRYIGKLPNTDKEFLSILAAVFVITAVTTYFIASNTYEELNPAPVMLPPYDAYVWNNLPNWIKQSLQTTLYTSLAELIIVAFLMAFAGLVIKGNLLAYFLLEPTLFDADDITALSLATHKTILASLQQAGIQTDALRLKHNFTGGRREEMI